MILLCLHVAVRRWWKSPKTELSDSGENPEGNVGVGTRQALLDDPRRGKMKDQQGPLLMFPPLTWCTSDMLARAVANFPDACKIADQSNMISNAEHSRMHIRWTVESQSGGRPYTVRLSKDALEQTAVPPKKIRELISCGCPGHTLSLSDAAEDRICKHCGAVMILCVRMNRLRSVPLVSGMQLTEPRPSGPAGSAARRDSLSRTRARRSKHQSIAICDTQPETTGPAATSLTQTGASVGREVFNDAGAVRNVALQLSEIANC